MNELTRRDAVKAIAAGAALSAAAPPAHAALQPAPPRIGERSLETSLRAAHLTACPVECRESNPIREGYVLHCRSWDSTIYLFVDEHLKGFIPVNPHAFAIAAAAQAADRPLAVRYWGHDPHWCGGAGRFDGALLAFDRRDLPSGESRPA